MLNLLVVACNFKTLHKKKLTQRYKDSKDHKEKIYLHCVSWRQIGHYTILSFLVFFFLMLQVDHKTL